MEGKMAKEEQSKKAKLFIVFKPSGKFMLERDEQPANAFAPIEVTLLGTIALAREAHPAKHSSSIALMPDGIAMLVREEQA